MINIPSPSKRQYGFTLLEMMVAVLLLSILALLTVQISQTAMNAEKQVRQLERSLGNVQRMFALFERDITQIIEQDPVNNLGGFVLNENSLQFITQDDVTAFVMPVRAQSIAVQWYYHNSTLWRKSGNAPDIITLSGVAVPQLSSIISLQWEVFNSGWVTNWFATSTLPRAIAITIEYQPHKKIRRIFIIPLKQFSQPGSDKTR